MSLHNGLDLVAISSGGVYTDNYGSTATNFIANLFASRGYLEDAPEEGAPPVVSLPRGLWRRGLSLIMR